MKVHELNVTTKTSSKRVGRGIGSGTGKTAGRGTKGQKSRTGGNIKPGFEGGQTKLAQRLPKSRGPKSGKFHSMHSTNYQVINLEALEKLGKTTVDATVLEDAGLIRSAKDPVKLLGTGAVTKKLTVNLQAASKSAIAAIEKAGGTFTAEVKKTKPRDTIKQPKKENQPASLGAKPGANEKRTKA